MSECCFWFINDIEPQDHHYKVGRKKWCEYRKCTSCGTGHQVFFTARLCCKDQNDWETWVTRVKLPKEGKKVPKFRYSD